MATDEPSQAPVTHAAHSRPLVDFLAGTAGGVAGIAVGHPFDTIKVRFQNPAFNGQYKSTLSAFKLILKQEKVRGLYKGVVSPIIGIAPVNGLVFASFKGAMAYLVPPGSGIPGQEAPLSTYFTAGCVSGIVASFINTPTELVKIRQQSFPGAHAPSTVALFKDIWRKGGVRGSFRGFTPCWMRDLGYGPYFLTYEYILRSVSPVRPPGPIRPDLLEETEEELDVDTRGWWAVAVAGGVAGVVSWTTTFPFDVLKTRMQASREPAASDPYRTTLSAARASYAAGGVRAFYVGLAPTLLRAIPTNMVTFAVFEVVVACC